MGLNTNNDRAYRASQEIQSYVDQRDPIALFRQALVKCGVEEQELLALDAEQPAAQLHLHAIAFVRLRETSFPNRDFEGAANAALDHVRTWVDGTPEGDWTSMAVPSDGSYGVPEGLMSSFPCVCVDGRYEIVPGLDIDDFSRARIDASAAELADERDAVRELGLI